MKITSEFLVNFLSSFYSKRHAHEDYINLYKEQLEVILEILNIKGLITFDNSDENNPKFKFNRLFQDYIRSDIMQEIEYENLEMTEKVINWCINESLNKIQTSRSIRDRGQMTTFADMESVHNILNTRQKDYAIGILNKSIIELYKEEITEALGMLYTADSQYKKKLKDIAKDEDPEWDIASLRRVQKSWSINNSATEEQMEILDKSICDWDYM